MWCLVWEDQAQSHWVLLILIQCIILIFLLQYFFLQYRKEVLGHKGYLVTTICIEALLLLYVCICVCMHTCTHMILCMNMCGWMCSSVADACVNCYSFREYYYYKYIISHYDQVSMIEVYKKSIYDLLVSPEEGHGHGKLWLQRKWCHCPSKHALCVLSYLTIRCTVDCNLLVRQNKCTECLWCNGLSWLWVSRYCHLSPCSNYIMLRIISWKALKFTVLNFSGWWP